MPSRAEVQVVPIAAHQQPVLRHLIDLYVYDFSERLGLDVEEDGRFSYPDLSPYWTDPERQPFFVRVGGKLAGFVLLHHRSRLSGATGVHDVAEFFILRKYRRQRVGERVATSIFERFPGAWEVRQRENNRGATAFWRQVIGRYTQGQFRELSWNDGAWQGPVQMFTK